MRSGTVALTTADRAGRAPGRWLALALIALTIAAGSWIRFAHLGSAELTVDELDHYYAARGIIETGKPVLPSGRYYGRGIEYTRLVQHSLSLTEQPAIALRAPSAILGVLGLVLFATIAWAIAGPWAAFVATFLLAIYPEHIHQSRNARFYTMQLVFALLAMYAAWRVIARSTMSEGLSPADRRGTWAWAAVGIAAFAIAAKIQVVSVSILLGWVCALALVAVWTLRSRGRSAWRASVPVQLVGVGLVGAVLLLLVPAFATELLARSTGIPYWARTTPAPPLIYVRWLAESLPVVTVLSVLSFPVVLMRRPWLGVFLLCWFAVPLAIHIALPFRQERYVLAAVPALFLATGVAAAVLFGALRQWARALLEARAVRRGAGGRSWLADAAATASVVLVGAVAVVSMPAARYALDPDRAVMVSWRPARDVLEEIPRGSTLPVGSTSPLAALFYLGRVDFVVSKSSLESWVERGQSGPDGTTARRSGYEMRPEGAPDFYTGAQVLTTRAAIARRYGAGDTVLVVIERRFITFGNLDTALEAELSAHAEELCDGRCGEILLYRWVPNVAPSASAVAPAPTSVPAART